jgi:hypothetical protein
MPYTVDPQTGNVYLNGSDRTPLTNPSTGQPYGTPTPTAPTTTPTSSTSTPSLGAASVPGSTSGLGLNVNSPSWNGTGQFVSSPYPINDTAITGTPTNTDGNYGLNTVWNNLAAASASNQPLNVANAPAQYGVATGQGAQGVASNYNPATGSASNYSANTIAASSYQASQAAAATYNAALAQGASYTAAQMAAAQVSAAYGQASSATAASGNAAQAAGYSQMTPAQMQAAALSTNGDAQWQNAQLQLANTLQTQAAGGGVSPADLQLQQGEQSQIAAQLAALGSQRGNIGGAGLSAYSAANSAANAQAQLNQSMGIQRAQETLNAQSQLGTLDTAARGQSQAYNLNAAQLQQAAASQNASMSQASAAANQAAGNQFTEYNTSAQNAQLLANENFAQQNNEYNATNAQGMTLANMNSANAANQYNASSSNAAAAANMAATNTANSFDAEQAQQNSQFNASATNAANSFDASQIQQNNQYNATATTNAAANDAAMAQAANIQNANSINAANQYDATNDQGMTLANMNSLNAAGQFNAGADNTMTGLNMASQNQFTAANMAAQNAANAGNAALLQSTNQNNSANALTALANSQNYNLGLAGAMTGISEANKSAELANQTLQVNQRNAVNNINENAFNTSAMANSNFAGAIYNGVAGGVGAAAQWISKVTGQPTTANDPNAVLNPNYTPGEGTGGTGGETSGTTDTGGSAGTPGDTSGTEGGGSYVPPDTGGTGGNAGGGEGTDAQILSSLPPGLQAFYQQQMAGMTPAQQQAFLSQTLSDENVKEGIQGGNPMLQSFLTQLHQSKMDQQVSTSTPFASNPTYTKESVGGSAANYTARNVTETAATTGAAFIPVVGPAVSGVLAGLSALANAFGLFGSGGSAPTTKEVETPGSGSSPYATMDAGSGIDDIDTQNSDSLSDESAKENVISGNQQLQSFLEAGNTSGSGISGSNNSFMNTGTPAQSTYVPAMAEQLQDPNAQYGQGNQASYTDAGYQGAAGVTAGSWNGGGWQGGGMTSGGGSTGASSGGGGWSGGGAPTGGGYQQQGSNTAASYNGGGSGGGGVSAGMVGSGGGMISAGGVSQNAGMTSTGVQTPPAPYNPNLSNFAGDTFNQTPLSGSNVPAGLSSNLPSQYYAMGQPQQTNPNLNNFFNGISNVQPSALSSPVQQYQPGNTATAQPIPAPLTSNLPTYTNGTAALATPATQLKGNTGPRTAGHYTGGNPTATPPAPSGIAGAITGQASLTPTGLASSLGSKILSDEDAKTDVRDVQGFLDSVHAHSYRYKDPDMPGAGHGTFVSPMAQEIESTDLGKSAVTTGPDGYKRVDYGKLQGTMLAGQAMLNERLNKLEGFLKAARS